MDAGAALLLGLLIRVVFAVITAAVAQSKGRSVVGWFFCGLLFALIATIIVACLPNLKEKKRREEYLDQQNRRLREQLMQEQIKNEAFRRHTVSRLDSHDQQLGVDTRSINPALAGPETGSQFAFLNAPDSTSAPDFAVQPVSEGTPRTEVVMSTPHPSQSNAGSEAAVAPKRTWHYESGGRTHGPISGRELAALATDGKIVGATLIWTEQFGQDWKPASTVKALAPYLRG